MDKGISPLIASVLLIAFTMTVAMLVGPFFTDTLKSTQQGTSENVEQVTKASNLGVKLHSIDYNGFEDQFELAVQNSGNEPFSNMSATFFGQQPFNKKWSKKLNAREIKVLTANRTKPEIYDSITLSLDNYPVAAERKIDSRIVKPAEERRYIVSNDHSDDGLKAASYTNNNEIVAGSCSQTVDAGQTYTFSSSCYSVTDTVEADKAFSTHFAQGGADGAIPESFAGKEFIYEECRGSDYFNIVSPYDSASVTLQNSTGTIATTTVSKGSHIELNPNIADNSVYQIISDSPILVTFDRGGSGDEYTMHPASDNLWGLMESLTVSKDNTHVEVWDSNGNKVKDGTFNKYDKIGLSIGGQGGSKTYRAKANKSSLGAWRCADGDNGETDIAIPKSKAAERFRLPEKIEGIDNKAEGYYLSLSLTNSGKCTVVTSDGKKLGSRSTSKNPPYPGFITFNSEQDFNITSRGALVECTAPATLQWEPSDNEGESNLYGTMPSNIAELK